MQTAHLMPLSDATPPEADATPARTARFLTRERYLVLLGWSFAFFSSVRVLSYLPTLWAIHASGDSSQHAAITWFTWLGANLTMACWLYENSEQRVTRAVLVNLANAAMCGLTLALILWHRL
jgi:hypothetical protein